MATSITKPIPRVVRDAPTDVIIGTPSGYVSFTEPPTKTKTSSGGYKVNSNSDRIEKAKQLEGQYNPQQKQKTPVIDNRPERVTQATLREISRYTPEQQREVGRSTGKITQNIGESNQAYNERLRKYGQGLIQMNSSKVKDYYSNVNQNVTNKSTKEDLLQSEAEKAYKNSGDPTKRLELQERLDKQKGLFFKSATETYYETTSKILNKLFPKYFGKVKFYEKGEKEKEIIAGTYIEPTELDVASNILVSSTDVFFKGAIFNPLISTGASAKVKQKAKQEVKYVRKFNDLTDEEYSSFVNNLRVKASRTDLREAYKKALQSGNKDLIKQAEKVLEDVMGKDSAKVFFKDVAQQEGFILEKSIFPTGIDTKGGVQVIEKTNLPNFDINVIGTRTPTIKNIPPTTATLNLFQVKDNSLQNNESNQNIMALETQQQKQNKLLGLSEGSSTATKQVELLKSPQKVESSVLTVQKEATKQQQQLKQKLETKQVLNQQTKQISKIKPKISIPKIPIFDSFGTSKNKISSSSKDTLFEVIGRRFGKDIKIFETTSKPLAERKLKSFLKGTLGRSGKIKKDGKELSFDELNFDSEFRPSKKDSSRIVQKARFSLSSGGERQEIQFFKRKSKKKKGFNWF